MIAEPYRTWVERWEKTLSAVRCVGGRADDFSVGPPATERDIAATEKKIGRRLPSSFKRALLEFSGSVWVSWSLAGASEEACKAAGVAYEGVVLINLRTVERAEAERVGSCQRFERRRDDDESLDRWLGSLAWYEDAHATLGFDMRDAGDDAPVVLLEKPRWWPDCRAWLARDFMDFMDRWTRACSVQPDSDRLDGLVLDHWGGLDPDAPAARSLRRALGLDLYEGTEGTP
jgi:hypothetical protein